MIDYCIRTGRLYESYPHHNVVFVGLDKYGKPRYANLRGIVSDFKGEANGSDKRFSFNIPAENSDTVHLFESAIDLLSYATIRKMEGMDWKADHLVSLAGIYKPKENIEETTLPLALQRYLKDHPEIRRICLRLDNDPAGRLAVKTLKTLLADQYVIGVFPPSNGKDYNDHLCHRLGIPVTKMTARHQERYDMMRELYRIGNSLNQVAQKAHTLNVIDVQRYDAGVRLFEDAVKKITDAVVSPQPMEL